MNSVTSVGTVSKAAAHVLTWDIYMCAGLLLCMRVTSGPQASDAGVSVDEGVDGGMNLTEGGASVTRAQVDNADVT